MRRHWGQASTRVTRRGFLELLGLGGTAVLAGCATPPAQSTRSGPPTASAPTPARLTPVRYSMTSRTAGNWQDYIALRKGWFAENGIEPEIIVTGTTVISVQSLVSGST